MSSGGTGELTVIDAVEDVVLANVALCESGTEARGIAVQPFWWFEH